MRQIAHMGSGAVDDFARMVDQRVEFFAQWLKLAGELALDLLGLSLTHGSDRVAHAEDGRKADPDLEDQTGQQRNREDKNQAERDDNETPDFPVGRTLVLGR